MIADLFAEILTQTFPHSPTPGQAKVINAMARFVTTPRAMAAFVLRGYAGTGKTSLVGALVRTLHNLKRDVVLLAPTGRAAKVFSLNAGYRAYTIHKIIYRQQTFNGEGTRFSLGFNRLRNALFIVDEASMVANGDSNSIFGTGQLLDDLISYVYQGQGCRLMLVGDTAQLPPVGEEESPALNPDVLREYGLLVGKIDLTEVVRQSADSDVLYSATRLRRLLKEESPDLPRIVGSDHGEVRFLSGNELVEALISAYDYCGVTGTIVITRSNKRANIYNAGIRARIFDREDILTRGDIVMAVRNNYYWTAKLAAKLAEEKKNAEASNEVYTEANVMGFIANGDTAEVVRLHNVHEAHGFTFADATLRFVDYDDTELDCRVMLTTLTSESPSLTTEESHKLYESVLTDYAHLPSRRERMKALREDPYYNALQIKYAYAVTCHKAQGGQWERVFIDQGFLPADLSMNNYLRWLYTAFTRTSDRLYLINWPPTQREQSAVSGKSSGNRMALQP